MSSDNPYNNVAENIERLRRYADGAHKIFRNAESLYDEAQLLGQAGHFARASVLHQISMEECSKIYLLGATATSILSGVEVDERRLAKEFRDHKAKNHANAYLAEATEEEKAARVRGDWKKAIEAFTQLQRKFHAEANTVKNAGLCVDFKDGKFSAPVDVIDERTAVVFQTSNGFYLRHCDNYLSLLRKMVSNPDIYAELIAGLKGRVEVLRADKKLDFQQLHDVLMQEMLQDYKGLKDKK